MFHTRSILYLTDIITCSQFCIVVSGFRLGDATIDALYTPSYSTYTLFIIGKTDVIVPEERSRLLAQASANRRIEEHDGGAYLIPENILVLIGSHLLGHFVPSKGSWRKFLRDFMKDPFAEVLSPSASTQSSGSSTPVGPSHGSALMMKL